MHIAQFTNTYHPVISGVVRSVSEFRWALSEHGHNVFIFAQQEHSYKDREPFIFRYPALDLGLPGDFPATFPFSPFIDTLFPSLKVDVIHSHHPFLLGQAAVDKAKDFGLPLVFTFHTRYREYSHYFPISQETVQEFVKGAIDNWLRNYIRQCQHIVVPSESIRRILADEYGVISQTTVIPTGLNLENYRRANGAGIRKKLGWQDDTVLISVGRLAKEKNWETMLSAAKIVLEQRTGIKLVIIGDGPYREKLEKITEKAGIARNVEFVGKVPFEQVPDYLKAADLFCFASVTETQGLVTMEALAAGLPVVAVNATGTRDVLEDNVQGFLTENSPEALANGVLRILDDKSLYRRFQKEARVKVQEFDINQLAEKLVAVYEIAIEAKRANKSVQVESESGDAVQVRG